MQTGGSAIDQSDALPKSSLASQMHCPVHGQDLLADEGQPQPATASHSWNGRMNKNRIECFAGQKVCTVNNHTSFTADSNERSLIRSNTALVSPRVAKRKRNTCQECSDRQTKCPRQEGNELSPLPPSSDAEEPSSPSSNSFRNSASSSSLNSNWKRRRVKQNTWKQCNTRPLAKPSTSASDSIKLENPPCDLKTPTHLLHTIYHPSLTEKNSVIVQSPQKDGHRCQSLLRFFEPRYQTRINHHRHLPHENHDHANPQASQ